MADLKIDVAPTNTDMDTAGEKPPVENVDVSEMSTGGRNGFAAFWASIMMADDPPKILALPADYKLGRVASTVDNYFRISERGSSFWIEFTGGMTTFFSMCYILVLNGIIIGGTYNTGIPKSGVFFATALAGGIFTFMMGLVVNVPVALAPGMGLNGVFAVIAGLGNCPGWIPGKYGNSDQVLWDGFPGKSTASNGADGMSHMDMRQGCSTWGKTNLPWTDAMGAVFISGWFYLFFTFTGLRSMLFKAVPKTLRAAITVGIGFFITIIGLRIGKITRTTVAGYALPNVIAQGGCYLKNNTIAPQTVGGGAAHFSSTDFAGPIGQTYGSAFSVGFCGKSVDVDNNGHDWGMVNFNLHPEARISVLGFALVAFFSTLRMKGAIIASIVVCTFVGINYGLGGSRSHPAAGSSKAVLGPANAFQGNYFLDSTDSSSGQVNAVTNLGSWYAYDKAEFHSGLSRSQQTAHSNSFFLPKMQFIPSGWLSFKYAKTPIFWEAVWTFLFVELFDSFGTLTGIMTRCGFMKGNPEKAMTRVNRAMCIDGFGLWLGAIIGSNSITCYIESNTGVEAGARTGFASIVTGSLFLLSLLFVGPFVEIIPSSATTCALVMVGVYSLDGVRDINFDDPIDAFAAFFTIMTMGFTYSIANGICAGFIFYSFMKVVRFCSQQAALKLRPAWAFEESLDCKLPHPLMIVLACFMAIRFAYLEPGHQ